MRIGRFDAEIVNDDDIPVDARMMRDITTWAIEAGKIVDDDKRDGIKIWWKDITFNFRGQIMIWGYMCGNNDMMEVGLYRSRNGYDERKKYIQDTISLLMLVCHNAHLSYSPRSSSPTIH